MVKDKKYLRIIEYYKCNHVPEKQKNEFISDYDNHLFYSSVVTAENRDKVKESVDKYSTLYNNEKINEIIVPLSDVVIFDDLKLNPNQSLAYVYKCPVCYYTIVSSTNEFEFCPQCENVDFGLELVAVVNIEQLQNLINNNSKDVNTLAYLDKQGNLNIKCVSDDDEVY